MELKWALDSSSRMCRSGPLACHCSFPSLLSLPCSQWHWLTVPSSRILRERPSNMQCLHQLLLSYLYSSLLFLLWKQPSWLMQSLTSLGESVCRARVFLIPGIHPRAAQDFGQDSCQQAAAKELATGLPLLLLTFSSTAWQTTYRTYWLPMRNPLY